MLPTSRQPKHPQRDGLSRRWHGAGAASAVAVLVAVAVGLWVSNRSSAHRHAISSRTSVVHSSQEDGSFTPAPARIPNNKTSQQQSVPSDQPQRQLALRSSGRAVTSGATVARGRLLSASLSRRERARQARGIAANSPTWPNALKLDSVKVGETIPMDTLEDTSAVNQHVPAQARATSGRPITSSEVRQLQKRFGERFKACFAEHASYDAEYFTPRKVPVSIDVSQHGHVVSARVDAGANKPLGDCVAALIHEWRFPAAVGAQRIEFPFVYIERSSKDNAYHSRLAGEGRVSTVKIGAARG